MKIVQEIFEIRGADIGPENPLPSFRQRRPSVYPTSPDFPKELCATLGTVTKVLPYLVQDGYTAKEEILKLDSLVLENEYLKARFLPSLGGRLHSLYHKKLKKDLLFTNTVIRPGNLAIRDAWLSGGIEWNVGNFGHTYTTCDNVYAAVLDDGEGNEFLRIYEFERNKSIFWQADFHLPEGSENLICHVRLMNPFDKDTSTYWWSNIAVKQDGKTRILASDKDVISFVDGKCHFETLPTLDALPGLDASYPKNAPRAYDYFIQPENKDSMTWEMAAYGDGTVFYERSTPPLSYKKLFCWGTHKAGVHWQEFLSDGEGTGYYAEIQGGIAPSQLHDKLMPKNSVYEWTQCYGGFEENSEILFDTDYGKAVDAARDKIEKNLSEGAMADIEARTRRLADIAVKEENIRHTASGFGALEIKRMERDKDGTPPASLYFPMWAVKEKEMQWQSLLESGQYTEQGPGEPVISYNVSEKWLPRMKNAKRSWLSLLHLGVALYERHRTDVPAPLSFSEQEESAAVCEARQAWLDSLELEKSLWAYRNLAVLEKELKNYERAGEYYALAFNAPGAKGTQSLAVEYMTFLLDRGEYSLLWDIYTALDGECKSVDRISIIAAKAAVKLNNTGYLENFFAQRHVAIREGEVSLTDIWFEYCALLLAKERNIDITEPGALALLIKEAERICPPDKSIDFRMSYDPGEQYRVAE